MRQTLQSVSTIYFPFFFSPSPWAIGSPGHMSVRIESTFLSPLFNEIGHVTEFRTRRYEWKQGMQYNIWTLFFFWSYVAAILFWPCKRERHLRKSWNSKTEEIWTLEPSEGTWKLTELYQSSLDLCMSKVNFNHI